MKESQSVQVLYEAELNARVQFGLNTKAELLKFIGNQGLQDLIYCNTELWKNNPRKDKEIYVDAYKFRSNKKIGYIAFMKSFADKYVIKSFHLDYNKITLKGLSINTERLLKDEI